MAQVILEMTDSQPLLHGTLVCHVRSSVSLWKIIQFQLINLNTVIYLLQMNKYVPFILSDQ